jgi:hypothetical protein
MNTTPTRFLRPLPVKSGGKVIERYAVIVDGEKLGEVISIRDRTRYAGHQIPGRIMWFAKPNGRKGLGMDYPSRQAAAEGVVDPY